MLTVIYRLRSIAPFVIKNYNYYFTISLSSYTIFYFFSIISPPLSVHTFFLLISFLYSQFRSFRYLIAFYFTCLFLSSLFLSPFVCLPFFTYFVCFLLFPSFRYLILCSFILILSFFSSLMIYIHCL